MTAHLTGKVFVWQCSLKQLVQYGQRLRVSYATCTSLTNGYAYLSQRGAIRSKVVHSPRDVTRLNDA